MHQKYQTEKTNTTISPANIKKIRREIKLKKPTTSLSSSPEVPSAHSPTRQASETLM
ncbi:hypothetical protein CLOSCI_03168 [[Clostridium] scindens ATCC 35704]|nr:hypothetical protein CLOSCI_03168 [[Clostridium] scindens ATCC 35704]